MLACRAQADPEQSGDLLVGLAGGDQVEDGQLSEAESVGVPPLHLALHSALQLLPGLPARLLRPPLLRDVLTDDEHHDAAARGSHSARVLLYPHQAASCSK